MSMSVNMQEVCGVSGEFNGSLMVTELLAKTLENSVKSVVIRCMEECGKRHGFDVLEELRVLGLEKVVLIRKPMSKKSVSKDVSLKKVKVSKSSYPFPFGSSSVNLDKCNGIQYNRGLFTQCCKEQMSSSSFCKGCQSECDVSASGIPLCGTVQQRLATGLYEFKDPKGRSPIPYVKVLEKCKLTKEQVLEEASKLNIVIDEEHFVIQNKSSSKKESVVRGRPKKISGVVEADNVTDLFAKLTASGEEEDVVEEESVEDSKPKKSKAMSDEEKAAKKQSLEEERAAKKAEREAKLASDKAEREAKRKAEVEEKQQQREAKIAAEKEQREAKIVAEKEQREAKRLQEKQEKEAKKAQEKEAKKAQEKQSKKPKTVAGAASVPAVPAPAPVVAAPADPAPAPAKVTVTRIQIEGKQYLKSSSNILYNPETKEEVGIWDPETKTINDLPDEESDEEEEEDYEDEDN
jgi:hypothetical protein